MEQIRLGFESGLSIEQVSIYAKPEFDHKKMEEIRLRLKVCDIFDNFNVKDNNKSTITKALYQHKHLKSKI